MILIDWISFCLLLTISIISNNDPRLMFSTDKKFMSPQTNINVSIKIQKLIKNYRGNWI